MAMDVAQEASEALAESREQPTSTTTPRITKVTIVVREQSQESSYFEALPEPRGVEPTFN
jgi:hypothetical protein